MYVFIYLGEKMFICSNVPEVVYMQHLMGVEGVIVDLVREITEAVSDFMNPGNEDESLYKEEGRYK